jgi:hypothetical protein
LVIKSSSELVPGDALALTALTALTCLDLNGGGCGVDDVAAIALACSLTQLRSLDLGEARLSSTACLAAIGHLTQLTEFALNH